LLAAVVLEAVVQVKPAPQQSMDLVLLQHTNKAAVYRVFSRAQQPLVKHNKAVL
jgi:hypothetical protein